MNPIELLASSGGVQKMMAPLVADCQRIVAIMLDIQRRVARIEAHTFAEESNNGQVDPPAP